MLNKVQTVHGYRFEDGLSLLVSGNLQVKKVWSVDFVSRSTEIPCVRLGESTGLDTSESNKYDLGKTQVYSR